MAPPIEGIEPFLFVVILDARFAASLHRLALPFGRSARLYTFRIGEGSVDRHAQFWVLEIRNVLTEVASPKPILLLRLPFWPFLAGPFFGVSAWAFFIR